MKNKDKYWNRWKAVKNEEISLVRKAIEGVIKYQQSVAGGEVSEVFWRKWVCRRYFLPLDGFSIFR